MHHITHPYFAQQFYMYHSHPDSTPLIEMLCSPVLCPSLTLTNGMISYSDPTLGRDTVATHTCVAGSALTTDLSTRTCGVTRRVGVWSGSPLVCAGMGPPHTHSTNHLASFPGLTFSCCCHCSSINHKKDIVRQQRKKWAYS